MITDERRREVAEKMRGYDCSGFRESAIVPFLDCLGVGYLNWRKVLDNLADLIDRPTCRIVYSAQLHSAFGEPIDGLKIYGLSCEHQAIGPEKPEYCPKCGAVIADAKR